MPTGWLAIQKVVHACALELGARYVDAIQFAQKVVGIVGINVRAPDAQSSLTEGHEQTCGSKSVDDMELIRRVVLKFAGNVEPTGVVHRFSAAWNSQNRTYGSVPWQHGALAP